MHKIKGHCIKCGKDFKKESPTAKYCSMICFLKDFTRPSKPRNLIPDETLCMIWLGDVDNQNNPVVVHGDKVLKLRDDVQLQHSENKRINVICGNPLCVNPKHYELVDDLKKYGYL